MKSVFTAICLFFAVSAHAENLYRCQVSAQLKSSSPYVWTKVAYLSDYRYNQIQFSSDYDTTLNLKVNSDRMLVGTVNGQPNFILAGDVNHGSFESANAVGSINCDKAKVVDAAFVFKPSKSIYVQGDSETFNQISSGADLDNSCYFGSANSALLIVASAFVGTQVNMSPIEKDLSIVLIEKKCVRSMGSHDDYQCLEYKNQATTHVLKNCDYSPVDPRS